MYGQVSQFHVQVTCGEHLSKCLILSKCEGAEGHFLLVESCYWCFHHLLNIVSPPEVRTLVYLNIVKEFAKFCWHLYLLGHRATAGHRAHVRPVWMQSILAASVSGIFLTHEDILLPPFSIKYPEADPSPCLMDNWYDVLNTFPILALI